MAKPILSVRRFYTFFITWWLIWAILHAMILREMNISSSQVYIESVVSTFILAGITLVISNNMRYYLPGKDRWWYLLFVSAGGSFFWLLIVQLVLQSVLTNPFELELLKNTWAIRFGAGFLLIGVVSTFALLWYREQAEKQSARRKIEIEQLAKETELMKLRQKMQPHFLFNSLNSISALVKSDPQKARAMIQQLSDFLRSTLRKDHHQLTTVQEELDQLQLYLEIEKVRFEYRLKTRVSCPPALLDAKIPAFILQPVVENAIKFGLYDTLDDVTIEIKIARKYDLLQLQVQNPFDRETFSSLSGTGFGLSSIHRQLQLLYGRTDLLKTKKSESTFITQIFIPQ